MKKLQTALVAATVMGTTALAFSSPADAQWGWRGGYRGFGYGGFGYRGIGYGGYGGFGYRGYGYRGVGYGGYGGG